MLTKLSNKFFPSSTFVMVEDHSRRYGSLWEKNEDAWTCRCGKPFQTALNNRHHCRSCACCYCDGCTPLRNEGLNSVVKEAREFTDTFCDAGVRVCHACHRGECPGKTLRSKVLGIFTGYERRQQNRKSIAAMAQIDESFVNTTKGMVLNLLDTEKGYPKQFELNKGEKSNVDRSDVTPPVSGLFEIKNKTNEMVAVKLLDSRADKTWFLLEMTRPSFMVLLPGECLHCTFDPREQRDAKMDIIVVHDHPIPNDSGSRVVWDTRSDGATAQSISPCAFIPKFEAASSFKIFAHDHNALLKIHRVEGELKVSPRLGNGVDRIGILQRINGHRFFGNKVDFDTNCTLVKANVSVS